MIREYLKKKQAGRLSVLLSSVALISLLLAGCASQPSADAAQTAPVSPGKPTGRAMPPSLPTVASGPKTPEEIQAFAKSHGYNNVNVNGAKK